MAPRGSTSSTEQQGRCSLLQPSVTQPIRMLQLCPSLTNTTPRMAKFLANSTETEPLSSSWIMSSNTTKWVPPRLCPTSSASITPMAAMSWYTKYLAARYSTLLLPNKALITRMRLLLRSWVSRAQPTIRRELFMQMAPLPLLATSLGNIPMKSSQLNTSKQ